MSLAAQMHNGTRWQTTWPKATSHSKSIEFLESRRLLSSSPSVLPPAPSNLAAIARSSSEIDLIWTNVAVDVSFFVIERSSGGGVFQRIATATPPNYQDVTVAPLGVYTYRVEAVGASGSSVPSTSVTAQALAPQLVTPVKELPPEVLPQPSSDPSAVVTMNGLGYFDASDGVHGGQLWRTDGTTAGTQPVTTGQNLAPSQLINVNGTLYFVGIDPAAAGMAIYKSDGTASGTVLLKDVNPWGNAFYHDLTEYKGELYFRAVGTGTGGGDGLWRTDGTPAGTVLVKPFDDIGEPPMYFEMAVASGRLFLSAATTIPPGGAALWVSDGTAAETVQVADTAQGPRNLTDLTAVGDRVYFYAEDGSNNFQLWTSDGTAAGTTKLTNFAVGPLPPPARQTFAAVGGTVFFAPTGETRGELWKTDGTVGGTIQASDLGPAVSSIVEQDQWAVSGNHVYFVTTDRNTGTELWSTDGTTVGTGVVKQISADSTMAGAYELTVLNGDLYFTAEEAGKGWELWKSDGTASGTAPIASFPGPTGRPSNFAIFGSSITFTADDGVHGRELWETDGTAAGTHLVKDIAFTTVPVHPDWLTTANGQVFFAASDTFGNSLGLWKTDGTAAGTIQLTAGAATDLTDWNGTLYFDGFDPTTGHELWKSDGTPSGTSLVQDIDPGPGSSGPRYLTPDGHELYFVTNLNSLWVTDGSPNGAVELGLPGGVVVDDPATGLVKARPTVVNGQLFFASLTPGAGVGLWKTDGTPAGTNLVKADFKPDGSSGDPRNFTAFENRLYFFALNTTGKYDLWQSDGTPGGTVISPLNQFQPSELAVINGSLYFDGTQGSSQGLFKSDGTVSGTSLVTAGQPTYVTAAGNLIYFRIGGALWRTDGTTASTIRLHDLGDIDPRGGGFMTAVGGKLFFSHGSDVWRSDGTPEGTIEVALAGQSGLSQPPPFQGPPDAVLGDRVFYGLFTGSGGRDLYSASATPPAAPSGLAATLSISGAPTYNVDLSWISHSSNEAGFVVDRSTVALFSTIDKSFFVPAGTTRFSDTSPTSAATLYYRVYAVAAGGNSSYSNSTSVTTGAVTGTVFNDANNNGTLDPGEAGMPGVTVYIDSDGNGQLDPGEVSVTTDASGRYTIGGLVPGQYVVRELAPRGYALTAPLDQGIATTVMLGQIAEGPLFGDVLISSVPMNFAYLVKLARNYGQRGTFATGDLNGDGLVNFDDLLLVARNYGHALPVTTATEVPNLLDDKLPLALRHRKRA